MTATVMLIAAWLAGADPARPGADSPYLSPKLAGLMDAVTLHLSFDRGSMLPDMAEGDPHPPRISGTHDKRSAGPQFAPGLIGQALVLGSGVGSYSRPANVLLEKRGALACWVRPEGWRRPDDRNVVFAMTSNAAFYLERQGPLAGPDGAVRRHETVLYLARDAGRLLSISAPATWEDGRWYLLVANWSWPTFELSVNGEPFQGRATSGVPPEGTFGALVVGDAGAGPRGLLDELMAFRRPLGLDEVRLLWGLRDAARK